MAAALEGIRVVDFGQYIAGPLAAMLLAEYGADVVHIDPPGGPRWKGPADAYYNRGKKRITLDLKQEHDWSTAWALIRQADVVIENFRPGVMATLGLGPLPVTAENPALIYCSLPGFPASDPRASLAAWEGVVMAATSGYRPVGQHYYTDPDKIVLDDPTRPLFTAIPIASNLAGMLGATCVVMALIARERTGRGQCVDLPLSEAMIEVLNIYVQTPAFGTKKLPGIPLGTFVCADGRFVDWLAYPFRFVSWLLDAIGEGDAWRAEGLLDYAAMAADPRRADLLIERLTVLFRTRAAREWEELAIRLKIPLVMVQTPAEWLTSEHGRLSHSVLELQDPELGSTVMTGLAVTLSETPGVARPRHLPDADRDTVATTPSSNSARAAEPPLELTLAQPLAGMSVLDLTQVVAGPTAGRILADFGARVIKINHPAGGGLPGYLNRGKRTMLLDVQHPTGREVLWHLIDDCDVFIQNFALGAAERYGISYNDVRSRRPDIVYGSISAFAYNGPWGPRRGYEMQGQASTGLMVRYGGAGRWPLYQPHILNDAGTGIMGAFAIGLGLLYRLRTGRGQHVAASLSQTSSLHQAPYLMQFEHESREEPSGVEALGWTPLHRLYKARDRWFFIGGTADQARLFFQLIGLEDLDASLLNDLEIDGRLARALQGRFEREDCDVWVDRLNRVGIGAHAILTQHEAEVAAPYLHRKVVEYEVMPDGTEARRAGVGPWLSHTPPRAGKFVGPFGCNTKEILEEYGFGERIEELVALKVTALPKAPQ